MILVSTFLYIPFTHILFFSVIPDVSVCEGLMLTSKEGFPLWNSILGLNPSLQMGNLDHYDPCVHLWSNSWLFLLSGSSSVTYWIFIIGSICLRNSVWPFCHWPMLSFTFFSLHWEQVTHLRRTGLWVQAEAPLSCPKSIFSLLFIRNELGALRSVHVLIRNFLFLLGTKM